MSVVNACKAERNLLRAFITGNYTDASAVARALGLRHAEHEALTTSVLLLVREIHATEMSVQQDRLRQATNDLHELLSAQVACGHIEARYNDTRGLHLGSGTTRLRTIISGTQDNTYEMELTRLRKALLAVQRENGAHKMEISRLKARLEHKNLRMMTTHSCSGAAHHESELRIMGTPLLDRAYELPFRTGAGVSVAKRVLEYESRVTQMTSTVQKPQFVHRNLVAGGVKTSETPVQREIGNYDLQMLLREAQLIGELHATSLVLLDTHSEVRVNNAALDDARNIPRQLLGITQMHEPVLLKRIPHLAPMLRRLEAGLLILSVASVAFRSVFLLIRLLLFSILVAGILPRQ